jgi:hypothetical protein
MPRSGPARRHAAPRVPVIERKCTAGDLKPDAFTLIKAGRGGLEKEIPAMNFVRGVVCVRKQKVRPRNSDANKFRCAVGPDAHELRGKVRRGCRGGAIQHEAEGAENPHRLAEWHGRIHEQVIAQFQRCLIELPARRCWPAGCHDGHFRIVHENVAWLVGAGFAGEREPFPLREFARPALCRKRVWFACAGKKSASRQRFSPSTK